MALSALGAASIANSSVFAAEYPNRRVTIVVTAAPGAGGDMLVRLMAQKLSSRWNQTVVVDNKTGGGGILSANEALRSPADGHTLFVSNDSPAIAPNVNKKLPFDYKSVFEPISLLVRIDFKVLVRPTVPVNTVAELIALGKSSPGKLSFASAGAFTSHHLMAELFRAQAGFNALHVPYRGAVPAATSLMAGQTDYLFTGFTGISTFVESGQLREIATTGTARNALTPHLPTVGETLEGFSAYSWFAMWTRTEVPASIRSQLAAEITALMKEPDVVERVQGVGMTAVGSSPEELRAFHANEQAKWAGLPPHLLGQQ
jgi:tripartite-type tricarboxylate transporter receptor subunit TctC